MMARDEDALEFFVRDDDVGRRLDRVLRKLLPRAPLDRIYTALRKGEVEVDGERRTGAYRLGLGQTIHLGGSLAAAAVHPASAGPWAGSAAFGARGSAPTSGLPLERAPIPVLFRNDHIVVFDKPRGLPVHGRYSLAALAATELAQWSRASLSFRPGPVHRLDRDTTGIVVFALSLAGAQELSTLFRRRACEKVYLALLHGCLDAPVEWQDTLKRDHASGTSVADSGGLLAQTHVLPLAVSGGCTLARVRIVTGRTHQIRAQASLHGHPLVGDTRYGGTADAVGYVLHCARLSLPAGVTVTERTAFESPLPALSRHVLEARLGAKTVEHALSLYTSADRGQRP